MYAIVVFPVLSFTRQTLRTAELGLRGLVVYTFEMTAFFWKQFSSNGALDFFTRLVLRAPLRTICQHAVEPERQRTYPG